MPKTPSELLEAAGWKRIGGFGKYHNIYYWSHPDHQHLRRGFFTTTQAMSHQKYIDRYRQCTCTPKEFILKEIE